MKKFRCWYLNKNVGWVVFEKEFNNKQEAINYCESKTDYKNSIIVEEVEA